MRVMLDTNILVSMVFFTNKSFAQVLEYINQEHRLVLSSFVINELVAVAGKKFPAQKDSIDRFLSRLTYEFVYTPHKMQNGLFFVRDRDDYPVLYTAIIEDIDILITGDRDLTSVSIEKPEILTPSAFIEKYMDDWLQNIYRQIK